MLVSLIRRSDTRIALELSDNDGNIIYQNMVSRYKDKDIKFLAKLCVQTVPQITQILNHVCEVETDGSYQPVDIECEPPFALIETMLQVEQVEVPQEEPPEEEVVPPPPVLFTVSFREINAPRQYGTDFNDPEPQEALRAALNFHPDNSNEPLLDWSGKDKLCCLDIDYHYVSVEQRPDVNELKSLVSKIKPQPFCWHPSHRKGAKLYYACKPGFTAEELAAVAGMAWTQNDHRATFDLIKSTRHPCYTRSFDKAPAPLANPTEIRYTYGNGDLTLIRRMLLSEVEQSDIDELLVNKGWQIGKMLPHTECPISATSDQKLNVFIGERGVFCHRCQALGLGPRTSPGFIPFAAMIGGTDNRITSMIRNFCHLEHAKIVLQELYPRVPPMVLDIIYRVMLKIVHSPDDPRIPLAMVAGAGFIRSAGFWVSTDGVTAIADGKQRYVQSLPAALIPEEDGYTLNVPKATALLNSGDISQYGYPDITFIRGCKIYGQHLPQRTDEIIRSVIRKEFASCTPTYLPVEKRLPEEVYWGLIESEFPGIDRNYLMLLIAAKGATEGRLCQCPFMLVTGPSSSGKSTTPHIAAGIVGDKAEEPIWHPNPERFRASLMDAARESSYVVVNEVFKAAANAKLDHVQALNPMLSLTEDSRSHVLYVGSVPFGRLPLFILTDIITPKEVESDIQIARRFVYYRLDSRIDWEDTLISRGIRPHQFRLLSPDHALAADSLLSYVIDRYFQTPTSLKDIARDLSAVSLENYSDEGDRKKDLMIEFYKEVCKAPALTGSDKIRYGGYGWKRIDRIAQNRLNELWVELSDGHTPETWQHSRAVSSEDWNRLLNVGFPVTCDIRPCQTTCVYVRFREANTPRNPKWVNGSKAPE